MKKIALFGLLALIGLGFGQLVAHAQSDLIPAVATVVGVVDGDTFEVAYLSGGEGLPTTIRAYLVDAPLDGQPLRQCYGTESTAFAKNLLEGQTVWLRHQSRVEEDGALLAFVYLDSDEQALFQAIALSQGAALPKITFPEEQVLAARVIELFNEARDAMRGLWSVCEVNDTATSSGSDVAAQVFVNEVELNPAGEDAGNQFIELFNGTSEPVDLEGWLLVPRRSLLNLNIPSGLVIPARGFAVLQAPVQFLNLENEVIELRNPAGETVDVTLASGLTDLQDDANCWARVPDGADNWVFQGCTPNGKN